MGKSVHFVLAACVSFLLADVSVARSTRRDYGLFWQLTDIHWDRNYSRTGSVANWCHNLHNNNNNNSGGGGGVGGGDNGYYGNYSCDSPFALVKSAIEHMARVEPEPDFIIWTGDNAPHWDSGPDFDYIFSALGNITRLLRATFGNSTVILPCIGNHDSAPPNQFPGGTGATASWYSNFYDRYLSEGGWSQLMPNAESQTEFSHGGGAYKYNIDRFDLTVVVLNTNVYYRANHRVSPHTSADPNGQFVWLEAQLASARRAHRKVLIVSHIGPGYFERLPSEPFMYSGYNDRLLTLLTVYSDVIHGQVYGHSHTDTFRLITATDSRGVLQARSAALVAPSLTPWVPGAGTNPGVRLYRFGADHIIDYDQYILNLTEANARSGRGSAHQQQEQQQRQEQQQQESAWQHLYSARDAYHLPDLSAASLLALLHQLQRSARAFRTYYGYNTGGYVAPAAATCRGACRRQHLCAIVCHNETSMAQCLYNNNNNTSGGDRNNSSSVLAQLSPMPPLSRSHWPESLNYGSVSGVGVVVVVGAGSVLVLLLLVATAGACRKRWHLTGGSGVRRRCGAPSLRTSVLPTPSSHYHYDRLPSS